jgi:hypothetical protein
VIGLSGLWAKGQLEPLSDFLGLRVQGPEQEAVRFGARKGVCVDVADARAFKTVAADKIEHIGMASRLAIDEPSDIAQQPVATVVAESQGELCNDVLVRRDDVLEKKLLERRHLGTTTEECQPHIASYADQPPTRFRCGGLEARAPLYWLANRRAARSRRSARSPSSTTCVFVTGTLSPRATASSSSTFVARRSSSSSRSKVVRTLHRASYAPYAVVKETFFRQQTEGVTDTCTWSQT